jgi:hypothetical protein
MGNTRPAMTEERLCQPSCIHSNGNRTSVPIPKFASLRGTLVCELGIKGTLAIYDSSAVFGFEVPTHTRGYIALAGC